MKKRIRFKWSYVGIVIVVLGSMVAGIFWAYTEKFQGDWINLTSFVISVIALIISLVTYISIDAVNQMTTMDGNVLENENYTVAYSEMLGQFDDCETKEAFQKRLFDVVRNGFKYNCSTCIQYADNIQNLIDHIIWFAYLDFSDIKFTRELDKLIKRVDKKLIEYCNLSNGIQYTLQENVKLVKRVLNYQMRRSLTQGNISNFEDIRGKMIRNPISQIVYYDYLGLNYRSKVNQLLKACGSSKDEFTPEYMRDVYVFKYSDTDMENIKTLLRKARQAFKAAEELSNGDILWRSYISYNMARTEVMEWLIQSDSHYSYERLEAILEDVVNVRREACFLYGANAGAYLKAEFNKEYVRAKSLLENFRELKQLIEV